MDVAVTNQSLPRIKHGGRKSRLIIAILADASIQNHF